MYLGIVGRRQADLSLHKLQFIRMKEPPGQFICPSDILRKPLNKKLNVFPPPRKTLLIM